MRQLLVTTTIDCHSQSHGTYSQSNCSKRVHEFQYHLPEKLHNVTNPTGGNVNASGDSVEEEEDVDKEEEQEMTAAQRDNFLNLLRDECDVKIVAEDGKYTQEKMMPLFKMNCSNFETLRMAKFLMLRIKSSFSWNWHA
jgi:hypothetical protein